MQDIQYQKVEYKLCEREHKYGSNVHLINNPVMHSLLAILCSKDTFQPTINEILSYVYRSLCSIVINNEFPQKITEVKTRMHDKHKEAVYVGAVINPDINVVLVDLARAGMLPAMICYDYMTMVMNPLKVRQDHIFINRAVNEKQQVIGTNVSGVKIGGGIDNAFVIFPDPMGATGNSICDAVNVYKSTIAGKPKRLIAIHLIITPEYIKKMQKEHPDVVIYALRLDRGLSDKDILKTIPGTFWDKEHGLDAKDYIVPGAGGFGEIINNSYV